MHKSKFRNKRLNEIECVKRFLRNKNTYFDENEVILNSKEDDVIDVFFREQKFQIVNVPFEIWMVQGQVMRGKAIREEKVRGEIRNIQEIKTSWIEFEYKKEEVFQKFIVQPILKKAKYGNSAKEVILLLNCWTSEPPWVEKEIKIAKKLSSNIEFLKSTGFKEIYLVCWRKNIKIFP